MRSKAISLIVREVEVSCVIASRVTYFSIHSVALLPLDCLTTLEICFGVKPRHDA